MSLSLLNVRLVLDPTLLAQIQSFDQSSQLRHVVLPNTQDGSSGSDPSKVEDNAGRKKPGLRLVHQSPIHANEMDNRRGSGILR